MVSSQNGESNSLQGNIFKNMMDSWSKSSDLYTKALDSNGFAQERQNIYLESTKAKIQQLKTSIDIIWQNTISSQAINVVVSSLTSLIDKFMNLKTVIALVATGFAVFKGVEILNFFKSLPSTISETVKKMQIYKTTTLAMQMQEAGMITTNQALGASFRALGVSIKELFLSNPLGWIAIGITSVITAMDIMNAKAEETKQKNEELMQSFQTNTKNNADMISYLQNEGKQYDELKNKTQLTSEEQKNLTGIREKLASTFPEMVASMDSEGKAILDQKKNTQDLIEVLKERQKLENAKLLNNGSNGLSDLQNDLGKSQGLIQKYKKQLEEIENGKDTEYRGEVTHDAINITDLTERLKELRVEESNNKDAQKNIEIQKDIIDVEDKLNRLQIQRVDTLRKISSEQANENTQMAKIRPYISAIIGEYQGLTDFQKKFIENNVKVKPEQLLSIDKGDFTGLTAQINEVIDKIKKSSELSKIEVLMEIKEPKNADVQSYVQNIISLAENTKQNPLDLMKLMPLKVDSAKLKQIVEEYIRQIQEQLKNATSQIDKDSLSKLLSGLENFKISISVEGIDETKNKIASLSDIQKEALNSIKDAKTQIKDVNQALDEFNKSGEWNLETIEKLCEKYPTLLDNLGDDKAMTEALIKIKSDLANKAFERIDNEIKVCNELFSKYELDVNAFSKAESEKTRIAKLESNERLQALKNEMSETKINEFLKKNPEYSRATAEAQIGMAYGDKYGVEFAKVDSAINRYFSLQDMKSKLGNFSKLGSSDADGHKNAGSSGSKTSYDTNESKIDIENKYLKVLADEQDKLKAIDNVISAINDKIKLAKDQGDNTEALKLENELLKEQEIRQNQIVASQQRLLENQNNIKAEFAKTGLILDEGMTQSQLQDIYESRYGGSHNFGTGEEGKLAKESFEQSAANFKALQDAYAKNSDALMAYDKNLNTVKSDILSVSNEINKTKLDAIEKAFNDTNKTFEEKAKDLANAEKLLVSTDLQGQVDNKISAMKNLSNQLGLNVDTYRKLNAEVSTHAKVTDDDTKILDAYKDKMTSTAQALKEALASLDVQKFDVALRKYENDLYVLNNDLERYNFLIKASESTSLSNRLDLSAEALENNANQMNTLISEFNKLNSMAVPTSQQGLEKYKTTLETLKGKILSTADANATLRKQMQEMTINETFDNIQIPEAKIQKVIAQIDFQISMGEENLGNLLSASYTDSTKTIQDSISEASETANDIASQIDDKLSDLTNLPSDVDSSIGYNTDNMISSIEDATNNVSTILNNINGSITSLGTLVAEGLNKDNGDKGKEGLIGQALEDYNNKLSASRVKAGESYTYYDGNGNRIETVGKEVEKPEKKLSYTPPVPTFATSSNINEWKKGLVDKTTVLSEIASVELLKKQAENAKTINELLGVKEQLLEREALASKANIDYLEGQKSLYKDNSEILKKITTEQEKQEQNLQKAQQEASKLGDDFANALVNKADKAIKLLQDDIKMMLSPLNGDDFINQYANYNDQLEYVTKALNDIVGKEKEIQPELFNLQNLKNAGTLTDQQKLRLIELQSLEEALHKKKVDYTAEENSTVQEMIKLGADKYELERNQIQNKISLMGMIDTDAERDKVIAFTHDIGNALTQEASNIKAEIVRVQNLMLDPNMTNEQKDAWNKYIALLNKLQETNALDVQKNIDEQHQQRIDKINRGISEMDKATKSFDDNISNVQEKLTFLQNWQSVDFKNIELLQKSLYDNTLGKYNLLLQQSEQLTKLRDSVEVGSDEWNVYNDKLKEVNETTEASIMTMQEQQKALVKSNFDEAKNNIEKAFFNGSTSDEAKSKLDEQQKEYDVYIQGEEKALAIDKLRISLIKDIRDTTVDTAKTQLKAQLQQLELLDKQDKLTRTDFERFQKKLDILKLQQQIENTKNQKTIQELTQNKNGSWQWKYTADQDKIDDLNEELRQKQVDLIKWEKEQELKKQNDDITSKDNYLSELQKIFDKALNGQYASQAEFQKALNDLNTKFKMSGVDLDNNLKKATDSYSSFTTSMIDLSSKLSTAIQNSAKAIQDASALMTDAVNKINNVQSNLNKTTTNNVSNNSNSSSNSNNTSSNNSNSSTSSGNTTTVPSYNSSNNNNNNFNTGSNANNQKEVTNDQLNILREAGYYVSWDDVTKRYYARFGGENAPVTASFDSSNVNSVIQELARYTINKRETNALFDTSLANGTIIQKSDGTYMKKYSENSWGDIQPSEITDQSQVKRFDGSNSSNTSSNTSTNNSVQNYNSLSNDDKQKLAQQLANDPTVTDMRNKFYAEKDEVKAKALEDQMNAYMKDKYNIAYATGGENTTTGWHWLDGTKEKPERVLNAEQTKSFDKLVGNLDVLKNIDSSWLQNVMSMSSSFINNLIPKTPSFTPISNDNSKSVEQSIVIHANFPNVTDSNEVQKGLYNLSVRALQHAK